MRVVQYVTFRDGKTFAVELTVDNGKLATRMAVKARKNKSQRATMLRGAVVASIWEHRPK